MDHAGNVHVCRVWPRYIPEAQPLGLLPHAHKAISSQLEGDAYVCVGGGREGGREGGRALASFPGTLRGRKSAWGPLFAHVLNFQEFLEFRITTRLCP